jgi:hypothetical protein
MTPWSQLFFNKLFFDSLKNQGRDIIPPTHNKGGKKSLLTPYMSGYAFIYIDSKLK